MITKGALAAALLVASLAHAAAAEVKILTAGAMKEVVLAVVPQFERETGHKAVVSNDTAGVLTLFGAVDALPAGHANQAG